MKNISSAMNTHLIGEVTTLTWCWKATRTDNEVFGFTSFDRDLLIDGILYKAESGLNATNAQSKLGASIDNLDIAGLLDSDIITEQDLRSGLWDNCAVDIFIVNWQDTTQKLIVQTGTLGDVTLRKNHFVAEMRSLSHKLQTTIGRTITRRCDANFGDSRCKIPIESYTATGVVTVEPTTSNPLTFTCIPDYTLVAADPYWSNVRLAMKMDDFTDLKSHTVTLGNSPTINNEIKKYGSGSLQLNTTVNNQYLNLGQSSDWEIGSNDFTIEGWIRFSSAMISYSGYYSAMILAKDGTGSLRDFFFEIRGPNDGQYRQIAIRLFDNSTNVETLATFSTPLSLDTWYYVSVSRATGNIYFHLNGNLVGQGANNIVVRNTANNLMIGGRSNTGYENYLKGYIDDLRFTIGTGRYSASNYQVPTNTIPVDTPILSKIIQASGKLTWITGNNIGNSGEIKLLENNNQTITLKIPTPNDIQVGDTFQFQSGCDKNASTCSNTNLDLGYNNIINFRGFPHIPGIDKVMDYPNAH